MDLCHKLSAGIYLCCSPLASDNRLVPFIRSSAPHCRAYHCVFIPTVSGDVWHDRDILYNPCSKSSQIWSNVATRSMWVTVLRRLLPCRWYTIWTSSLGILRRCYLWYRGWCTPTCFSKKSLVKIINLIIITYIK